ncbi:MAG: isoprenylcysteine carboxylmethyltransferase family protein [Candidatus Aminicenantes bacterium]|nr:isoprenylcysteine carboxylmethyltransferase family protein [Candidatus Aminicenantes bacterium]
MFDNFSRFIFTTRRYYRIILLILGVTLKFFILQSTTTLLLWVIGFIFVLSGLAFRIHSAGYLHGRHIVTEIEAEFFCASGPYSYIRNPLYLGNFVVDLGIVITFNIWWLFPVYFSEFIFLYSIIIPYEEKFLKKQFGKTYEDYKSQIPAVFPSRKKYKCEEKVIPNRIASFKSELPLIISLVLVYILFFFLFVRESLIFLF